MSILRPSKQEFRQCIEQLEAESLDFIVLATGGFDPLDIEEMKACLGECVRVLRDGGLLFVQGRLDYLPTLGVFLDRKLTFKYWIAVESEMRHPTAGLPSVHAGILLFVKGTKRFHIERVRFPHEYCSACGKTLKDWGGKTHLMHPDGKAISDVWTELPPGDNYTGISQPVLDTILDMIGPGATTGLIAVGAKHLQMTLPYAGDLSANALPSETFGVRWLDTAFPEVVKSGVKPPHSKELPSDMVNVIHCGDAVEVLKRYPDECIDLVFADPPYNLEKAYSAYEDALAEQRYIEWCNSWLAEYVRVLKPTGSLYVLNLPRWTMYHADFLNQHLHFQNWIVWDALSEPMGKLMPAHYGLLLYTKHHTDFTLNCDELGKIDARTYCLRASCIRQRKLVGDDLREPLTDIWWDVHRIRHRRDRDYHPCQLPDALMERIIRLSSNPGDIVLDALNGVGTTVVAAAKLGRRYVGIDLDPRYVEITRQKLAEVENVGHVVRAATQKPARQYTKKELQLELRDIASRLGRLPTPEDIERLSKYGLEPFLKVFPIWSKALKAAKLEVPA